MTALDMAILSGVVALVMLIMTIQGDLKDIESPEPNIPRFFGVESGSHPSLKFITMMKSLILAKGVLLVSLAWGRWASVIVLSGASILLLEYNMRVIDGVSDNTEVSTPITKYTALTLISICISISAHVDAISIAAVVVGSLVWGLGFQKLLYGDHTRFA